jgi:hypothetical protein
MSRSFVFFSDGFVSGGLKSFEIYVRAVRGGSGG